MELLGCAESSTDSDSVEADGIYKQT